jgi:hypothetical protein
LFVRKYFSLEMNVQRLLSVKFVVLLATRLFPIMTDQTLPSKSSNKCKRLHWLKRSNEEHLEDCGPSWDRERPLDREEGSSSLVVASQSERRHLNWARRDGRLRRRRCPSNLWLEEIDVFGSLDFVLPSGWEETWRQTQSEKSLVMLQVNLPKTSTRAFQIISCSGWLLASWHLVNRLLNSQLPKSQPINKMTGRCFWQVDHFT